MAAICEATMGAWFDRLMVARSVGGFGCQQWVFVAVWDGLDFVSQSGSH